MTVEISRHPDASTLMSFVSGALTEPLAAVVAAHLSLCPHCRAGVADLELLGAAVIDSKALASGAGDGAPDGDAIVIPSLPKDDPAEHPKRRSVRAQVPLTHPLTQHYGIDLASVPWKRLAPGVWHHRLALSPSVDGDLRLLKIAAGVRMPVHGHGGAELTLVLDGAFTDETGNYRCGDLQDVNDDIEHRPIADKLTGCICLIASERPAKFKGIIGRLMQPWTGM